jgi:glutathione S-transferase
MKLYLFPPSTRVLGIVALQNHPALECEVQPIDLRSGDQLSTSRSTQKMPTLEDDGVVLWESNVILFYMAARGTMRHGA